MRPGTILVLLGLILLFAYFGWAAFGILALSILLFLVLAVGAVAVGLWVIKRRMRRRLEELGHVMEQHLRQQAGRQGARDDAIDVEATVRRPRDGADEPEEP
jgi:membrane protein implicated in regulation of membrane protease activity